MENEPKQDNLNQPANAPAAPADRNEFDDPALLDLEKKINNAKFPEEAPRASFQYELMSKLLEQRQMEREQPKRKQRRSFNMNQFFTSIASVLTVRRLAPVVALLLIAAIIFGLISFWPGKQPGQFAKLIISPVYAQDNFEVTAEKSDSSGIEANTAFIVKSKEKLNPADIKKSLSLSPAGDFDFQQLDDYTFRVTPRKILAARQVYQLKINAAYDTGNGLLAERDYSWAFQVKDQFKVLTTLPRHQATAVPLDTGIEITFSYDQFVDWDKYVKIEPQTPGRFEKHGRVLVFVPQQLLPGQIYKVTVSKDLPLENSDLRLKEDYSFQFETGQPGDTRQDWNLDFAGDYLQFTSDRQPAIGVYEYNTGLNSFPLEIYAFKSEQQFLDALLKKSALPNWAYYSRLNFRVATSGLQLIGQQDLALQKIEYNNYLVWPQPLPAGYYLAQTAVKGQTRQILFQVTDIGAYVSIDLNKTLVWSHDLRTKAPLANAAVSLVGQAATAQTDSQGIAELNTADLDQIASHADEGNKSAFLKIDGNGKSLLLPLSYYDDRNLPTASGWRSNSSDSYWNYLYLDRDLYQTSDTINTWGIIRSRDGQPVKNLKLRLVNNNYYNYDFNPTVVAEADTAADSSGFFTAPLKFSSLSPGYYSLELVADDTVVATNFVNIQTYAKPAYKVDIYPAQRAVFAGEDVKLKIKTAFFDGTPVGNLDLTYTANELTKQIKTDNNGSADISLPTSFKECQSDNCSLNDYLQFSLHPTKAETGDIYSEYFPLVFNFDRNLDGTLEQISNSQTRFSAIVRQIALDKINSGGLAGQNSDNYLGPALAGINVDLKIINITYNQVEIGQYYDFINKRVVKQYRYDEVDTPAGAYSGTTDAQGRLQYDFNIATDTSYRVDASIVDSRNHKNYIQRYVYTRVMAGNEVNQPAFYGYKYYPGQQDDYYHLEFLGLDPQTAEAQFSAGDTVKLQLMQGYDIVPDSRGNFLYYQLQRGLRDYQVADTANYSFQFSDDMSPNVSIRAVYFDGDSYRDAGPLAVPISTAKKKLNLEIKADADKYRPGDEAQLSVKVTDANNQPVAANVNLNLVDEALYRLSDQQINILGTLYQNVTPGELNTVKSHANPWVFRGGAEKGGCFAAGTKVTLASGALKNIEDIKPGEEILTYSGERTSELVKTKVLRTFEHNVEGYIIINGTLKVTPEHRVFVSGGWEQIGQAKIGDYLLDQSGNPVRIRSIDAYQGAAKVYNLETEIYHTYFANGIYVHNDKGGGRSNFVDVALFKTIETDSSGQATVKFKLPDNITSWRVTAQALTADLQAGSAIKDLIVSLPLFVETTLPDEYLLSDQPIVKARVYGDATSASTPVNLILEAPDFGAAKATAEGLAQQAVYFNLPQLQLGKHQVAVSASAGNLNDKVVKTINVKATRLTQNQSDYYQLATDLKLNPAGADRYELTLSDGRRGQYYQALLDLSWGTGDVLDQKTARVAATQLLAKYFNEQQEILEDLGGSAYQTSDGGIAILPYGGSDPQLSAQIAAVAKEQFDQAGLASYFYKILTGKDSAKEEVGWALYGLAALGEPVLTDIQHYAALSDLTTKEKIYSGLALAALGDKEAARKIYFAVLKDKGEQLDQQIRVNDGAAKDETLKATALMLVLAGVVGDDQQAGLWNYLAGNYGEENLFDLEKIAYLQQALPQLPQSASEFSISIGGRTISKQLKNADTYKVSVSAEEFSTLKINSVKGEVGLTVDYQVPYQTSESQSASSYLSLGRAYYVNGKQTNSLHEDDLVEIRLTPQIGVKAVDGSYQITDLLPSGLKPLTNLYTPGLNYECHRYYPYSINGQAVKFLIYKGWSFNNCSDYFSYYARVVAPGVYTAESAKIQSLSSLSVQSYSTPGKVQIEK